MRSEVCGSEVDQCVSLTAGAPAAHARTETEPISEAASAGSAAGSRLLRIMWRNVAIFSHFSAYLASRTFRPRPLKKNK